MLSILSDFVDYSHLMKINFKIVILMYFLLILCVIQSFKCFRSPKSQLESNIWRCQSTCQIWALSSLWILSSHPLGDQNILW